MDCANIHAENTQLHMLFDAFHRITKYDCAVSCNVVIMSTYCHRKVIGEDWSFESIFEIIRVSSLLITMATNYLSFKYTAYSL